MKIIKLLLANPIRAASVVFLAISIPLNHFVLDDYPENPLEKAEDWILQHVFGLPLEHIKESPKISN